MSDLYVRHDRKLELMLVVLTLTPRAGIDAYRSFLLRLGMSAVQRISA